MPIQTINKYIYYLVGEAIIHLNKIIVDINELYIIHGCNSNLWDWNWWCWHSFTDKKVEDGNCKENNNKQKVASPWSVRKRMFWYWGAWIGFPLNQTNWGRIHISIILQFLFLTSLHPNYLSIYMYIYIRIVSVFYN